MNRAIKLLEQEVKWHKGNRFKSKMPVSWTDGFIKGCEHCLVLLVSADSKSKDGKK